MKRIIVGIEGGGTSTRMLVEVDGKEPIFLERKGSLKFSGEMYEASALKLLELLRELPEFRPMWVRSIAFGLSGASIPSEQELYRSALRDAFGNPALPVHIEGDASLSFKSAIPDGEPGMLLIAGTGTVLLVRDDHNVMHLIGGWGNLIGDEGSGFWIGVEALKHVTKVSDGILPSDRLYDAIMEHLPTELREQPRLLSRRIDSESLIPSEVAPLVFLLSSSDPTAKAIIRRAGHELASFVRDGIKRFDERTYAELYVSGSIVKQAEILDVLQEDLLDFPIVLREVSDRGPAELALKIAKGLESQS